MARWLTIGHSTAMAGAAGWGIVLALSLGLVKASGGYFGHSLALLSDAVHSLVDAAIAGALLGALFVAERPADREHPYGHGRAEALAGAGVALLLLLLAAGHCLGGRGDACATSGPLPETYTLAVAAGVPCSRRGCIAIRAASPGGRAPGP